MNRRRTRTRPDRGHMILTGLLCVLVVLDCFGTRAVAANRYDVEVIVFRQLAASDDGEQWPMNTTVADNRFARTPLQQGLENLPDSQFALNGIADALQRSGAYQVLVHRIWRQDAYDRHSAVPYLLHTAAGSSGREVDGSITLIRERYLHLSVDLTLTSPDALYRLDETRRMRSGELHYFDNPRFGVIARVTPYESDDPVPEEDAGAAESTTVPDEEADTATGPAGEPR